jgi:uncharacterized protein YjbI with pentapeptide repeats
MGAHGGADLTGAQFVDGTDLTGASLSDADVAAVASWSDTMCPDGTNSDNDANTCANNLTKAG